MYSNFYTLEKEKTMKRLLRVSFDIFIMSIIPIISWFFLGIILDNNLINIYTLTYPLQCLMSMIVSVFGVGANICIYKDNNKNSADNGIFWGSILSIVVYGIILFNLDTYIDFMNMDIEIYKIFCSFSLFQIFFYTILELILTKLYYKDENKKANKIAFFYNFICFISLIIVAQITKSQLITAFSSGVIIFIMIVFILIKNIEKIDFKLNVWNCFKYNSVALCVSFMFLLIYLFGLSNSFEYGKKYIIAITFATLVTDMQWDITEAVKTVAKIDIAKKKFDYNEHLKNAIKLHILLIISVLLMTAILYPFYKPDLMIIGIYISLHILDFILTPFIHIKTCFLQLEDSAFKMTANMIIAYAIRTIFSFIPTPFCIILGQIWCVIYEFVCTKINYKKYENKKTVTN